MSTSRVPVDECAHEHYAPSGVSDGACQMLRCLDCGALDEEW